MAAKGRNHGGPARLVARLCTWARILVAAIAVAAIPAAAHAGTVAAAAAPENSPPGLARNLATSFVAADPSQAPESPLETALAYWQLASDVPYATRGGDDVVRLFHGSVGDYSRIVKTGLDPGRAPTWVTTSRAAAQDAIGAGRVLSPGQGVDRGIIESIVPRVEFERLIQSGGISPTRNWPGFGGGQVFPENVLRSPEAIKLFNRGIVP